MRLITANICDNLYRPNPASHKGDNGRVLVIAGSDKFHGALLLTVQALSRIVDMVYVYSTSENLDLVSRLKSEIAVFIPVRQAELWPTMALVDAAVVGPGVDESDETRRLLQRLLTDYAAKSVVVDATALWIVDPVWFHPRVIATPHTREFVRVFNCPATPDNVLAMAKKYHGAVVLKGRYDYVSDGVDLWENRSGNVGMTKGGTGDVLAGVIAGLAAKNPPCLAAMAGVYLTGAAGDSLYKKFGTFYNAEDLWSELGLIWREYVS